MARSTISGVVSSIVYSALHDSVALFADFVAVRRPLNLGSYP